MSQEQLSKGRFNLVELVSSVDGYRIDRKSDVIIKPELLYVFIIKESTYASAQKVMLEELSELNGGYKNREALEIPPPPEGTNAYSIGIGVKRDPFETNGPFFFPVAYCHIDESYLE